MVLSATVDGAVVTRKPRSTRSRDCVFLGTRRSLTHSLPRSTTRPISYLLYKVSLTFRRMRAGRSVMMAFVNVPQQSVAGWCCRSLHMMKPLNAEQKIPGSITSCGSFTGTTTRTSGGNTAELLLYVRCCWLDVSPDFNNNQEPLRNL